MALTDRFIGIFERSGRWLMDMTKTAAKPAEWVLSVGNKFLHSKVFAPIAMVAGFVAVGLGLKSGMEKRVEQKEMYAVQQDEAALELRQHLLENRMKIQATIQDLGANNPRAQGKTDFRGRFRKGRPVNAQPEVPDVGQPQPDIGQ